MNQSFSDHGPQWRRTDYVVSITRPLELYEELRSWMGFTLEYREVELPNVYFAACARFRIEHPDPLGDHRVYVQEGSKDVLPALLWLQRHLRGSSTGTIQITKLNQPK